jgi:hypothetical protein
MATQWSARLYSAPYFPSDAAIRRSNSLYYFSSFSYETKIFTEITFQKFFKQPYCPNADKAIVRNMNSTIARKFNEEQQSLYDYVAKYTGVSATFSGTNKVFDVLRSAKANSLGLPEWATEEIYKKMAIVYYNSFDFSVLDEFSQKFSCGNTKKFF